MPAIAAENYEWAAFSGSGSNAGILQIRDTSGNIECKYARYSGETLYVVTLGGAAYSWNDQCTLASYTA
jgi:hypothetical protein